MENNREESNPLLREEEEEEEEEKYPSTTMSAALAAVAAEEVNQPPPQPATPRPPHQPDAVGAAAATVAMGWTAEGLPMSLAREAGMMRRGSWDTGLCAFLGRNDEFCGSDLEVCVLGGVAPCVLHGSNAERLEPSPGHFANQCFHYSALYTIGCSLFGWNCMAPWISYPGRTAIRQKFNLVGTCETLAGSCECCRSIMEDEESREQCECDLATHAFCHPCALCQEGRELRRRLPHPGFSVQPILVMIPPPGQSMGRDS